MKKSIFTIIALFAIIAVATPALATDVSFKGQLRTRGYSDSNISLDERTQSANSWMDMRFRLQTVFTISDALSVTTRFDALDNQVWGQAQGGLTSPNIAGGNMNGVNFDRAFMTIKTDFGKFDVGRMLGGVWGTTWQDSEGERDRIKYTLPIGDFVLLAIFEKNAEVDGGIRYSDMDVETYYIAGLYKSEVITAGLLAGYTMGKNGSDDPSVIGAPLANPNGNLFPSSDTKLWLLDPYFVAKFADFTLQGELFYRFGQAAEWDRAYFKNANTYPGTPAAPVTFGGVTYTGGTFKDIDMQAWSWNLEGSYELGPLSFEIGYAWMQGQGFEGPFDANGLPSQKDPKVRTLGGVGADWDKLWILTATEDGYMSGALGTAGNINGGVGAAGAKIFYIGAGFKPLENLSLDVLYGNAKAEAPVVKNQSKDYGNEYDFKLVWDVMDNLQYTFIAAYLDAGDFYQTNIFANQTGNLQRAAEVKLDNTYSLFNEIKITF